VEMREGESLIIGGLKEQQRTKTVRGVPLLKDIPVLGNLFKNVREETSEQELVVMVTPRFVKPLSADQVPEFPSLVDPKK
jgi:Flp pilus assembly secretin CpaC